MKDHVLHTGVALFMEFIPEKNLRRSVENIK